MCYQGISNVYSTSLLCIKTISESASQLLTREDKVNEVDAVYVVGQTAVNLLLPYPCILLNL